MAEHFLSKTSELLSWRPNPLLREPATLESVSGQNDRPQLLVCHDLAGGYTKGETESGGSTASDDYMISHAWHVIDIFIYFSHHLVTIPPAGWISAAHRHGTKVLGTFITEWDEGAEACEQLFVTPETSEHVANQLCAIAAHHRFDGWLLNIENRLSENAIAKLSHFISVLTEQAHQMSPAATILWYDAVTTEGKLEWQDSLSPLNEPFFQACDGLFVNYTWKEETPVQTAAAAVAAARRPSDVFMGIDVHGRNTYGGGGMDCCKAVRAAVQEGLSVAIFAPGWVWENGEKSSWRERDRLFWERLIEPWQHSHPVASSLPLCTDFNQGYGRYHFSEGKLIHEGPWWDIAQQSLQPSFSRKEDTGITAMVSPEWPFHGGSSLHITGVPCEQSCAASFPLFRVNVPIIAPLEAPETSVFISITSLHIDTAFEDLLLDDINKSGWSKLAIGLDIVMRRLSGPSSQHVGEEKEESAQQTLSFGLFPPESPDKQEQPLDESMRILAYGIPRYPAQVPPNLDLGCEPRELAGHSPEWMKRTWQLPSSFNGWTITALCLTCNMPAWSSDVHGPMHRPVHAFLGEILITMG